MSDYLDELYQTIILEHSRAPRNFGKLPAPALSVVGYNPLCGDQLGVSVVLDGDVMRELNCFGQGCAISKASASILTTLLKGQSRERFYELFAVLEGALRSEASALKKLEEFGDLAALSGVRKFPARVKCATLAWQSLKAALENPTTGKLTVSS
jgi:nitrogen fixation protein NifU and related proteins